MIGGPYTRRSFLRVRCVWQTWAPSAWRPSPPDSSRACIGEQDGGAIEPVDAAKALQERDGDRIGRHEMATGQAI
jgi:hypothetical protein